MMQLFLERKKIHPRTLVEHNLWGNLSQNKWWTVCRKLSEHKVVDTFRAPCYRVGIGSEGLSRGGRAGSALDTN